jgi:error-prone DNA polymerase
MFVELHGRSAFTFLQGGSAPEEMVEVAANLNQPAIAILDRNGV